jgi:hypothetical protein
VPYVPAPEEATNVPISGYFHRRSKNGAFIDAADSFGT